MVNSLSWCTFDMMYLINIVEPLEQAAELQRVQQSIKEYLVAGMPRVSNNLCVSPKWTKKVMLS